MMKSLAAVVLLLGTSAHAADIRPYLVGDLEALTVKSEPVQVAEMKVVSDMQGSEKTVVPLGDMAGKVLVITFYSWSCTACRAHLRSLETLQRKLGVEALEVIPVHLGEGGIREAARTLDRWGLDSLQAYEPLHQSLVRDFGVDPDFQRDATGPMSIIVDPGGTVRATTYRLREWEAPETLMFFEALARGDI